jgi:hypothetical protein
MAELVDAPDSKCSAPRNANVWQCSPALKYWDFPRPSVCPCILIRLSVDTRGHPLDT